MKAGAGWVLQPDTLPGLSVGDVVALDIAEGEYAFSEPRLGRAAGLQDTSTDEDTVPRAGVGIASRRRAGDQPYFATPPNAASSQLQSPASVDLVRVRASGFVTTSGEVDS